MGYNKKVLTNVARLFLLPTGIIGYFAYSRMSATSRSPLNGSIIKNDSGDDSIKKRQQRQQEIDIEESSVDVIRRFETSPYQMFPDDPYHARHSSAMAAKEASKFYDPCKLSARMSYNCLERVKFKPKLAQAECKEYFDAYKECKAAWRDMLREQKSKGL
ncbi:hypothetical protein V1511DRAFT_499820 [Dipodascopsis uninucleata]